MYEINKIRLLLLVVVLCLLTGLVAALITQRLNIDPRSFGAQAFGLSLILGVVLPLKMTLERKVRQGGCRWLRK